MTKEIYKELYWSDLYSLSDIAEVEGVCPMTIFNRMKKAGIPRRTSAEALRVERCRAKRSRIRLQFHKDNPNYGIGKNSPRWKGGIQIDKQSGCVRVYVPHHPLANKRGYVKQHRVVMEKELGRYLLPDEMVYHKDGNGGNNDTDNLRLFVNQSEMVAYLNTQR